MKRLHYRFNNLAISRKNSRKKGMVFKPSFKSLKNKKINFSQAILNPETMLVRLLTTQVPIPVTGPCLGPAATGSVVRAQELPARAGLRSHSQVARLPDRLLRLALRLASLSPHRPPAPGRVYEIDTQKNGIFTQTKYIF